ncbi:WYL domain-containing protein [Halobacteriovorax sp. DPLXC-1]|uniref:WYL domain-containing protein n=1 Tax=Halobacteriovorax sp. DPLXC-1 TaxID=3110771 RepID=UPI002FEFDD87
MGSTTQKFFNVIEAILSHNKGQVSEEELKSLLGNPPRSTWFKQKKELINENYGLIDEFKSPDGQSYFTLKPFNNQYNYLEKRELYIMEAYKHLGFLLDANFDAIKFHSSQTVSTKDINELSRKFFYLSKNHAKTSTKEQKEIYENLTTSLLQNKEVYLHYPSSNDLTGENLRRIRPLTICYHLDDLYLLAYEEKIENGDAKWVDRNFKLSRIKSLELSNNTFKYPSINKWNPTKEYEYASGLYKGEIKTATANVYGVLRKLLEEKDIINSSLVSKYKDYDTYEFKYSDETEFLGKFMTWADSFEILAPVSLKDHFIQKLEAAISLNRSKKLKKAA